MVVMQELSIYVFYDIEGDAIRGRVADACKDYGLGRIQFSGFSGSLGKNKREELFLKLSHIIGDHAGKILMLPVCEKDINTRKEIINMPSKNGASDASPEGQRS